MSLAGTGGLHTDQAPPLSIPLTFFLLAPLALMAAGVMLIGWPQAVSSTHWSPHTIALTHLGTLGLLGAVMLGALYQMIPVVAGAPVPLPRLGHLVAAALLLGLSTLIPGLTLGSAPLMTVATYSLGAGLILFTAPVSLALLRTPASGPTVWGLRLALLALIVLAGLGIRMAWAHASLDFPAQRLAWIRAHAIIAFVVWVAGLIVSVSWQVIPMFYLTEPFPQWAQRATLIALSATLALTLIHLVWPIDALGHLSAALPGALAVWLMHPIIAWRLIAQRKRRRKDASVDFWRAALPIAPLCLITGLLTWYSADPRWPLLFGWLTIWGYAGLIMHGMLTRIVPFLVWFHRFAAWAGIQPIPPMRRLLPDARARWALRLHLAALALGAVGIGLRLNPLLQLAGLALIATGGLLFHNLRGVLAHKAPTSEPKSVQSAP
jgi:hypothetical protein